MYIKCYELIEKTYSDKVSDAKLYGRDGTYEELASFMYQPIDVTYDDEGIEHISKKGEIVHKIRFCVTEPGSYRLVVNTASGEEVTLIDAIKSEEGGFVRVSSKNPGYFELSDGRGYFPIGINMCFPTSCVVTDGTEFGVTDAEGYMGLRQYERWFSKCAARGVNLVRLWLGHDYFCPDTEDARILSYEQLARIDMVVTLAKRYGIRLKLTLEQFRYFITDESSKKSIHKSFNKVLTIDGEPCGSVGEWMEEEKWRSAWLKKIEVLSAMFSRDIAIFAVELWNEMYFGTREWNEYMLTEVKKLFPNTMVVNSLGSLDCDSNMKNYMDFPWEKSDFKQLHRYLDQGGKYPDTTLDPIDVIKYGLSRIEDKTRPVIVAETGAVSNCHSGPFKYYPCDDRGIIFVDLVYAPVFFGAASCGHIWHWDERYVESKGLCRYFEPLARLIEGVDFCREDFVSRDLSDSEATMLVLEGKNHILCFCRNKSDSWHNTLRDMKDPVAVDYKSYDIGGEDMEVIPIWQEDTVEAAFDKGRLRIRNMQYGVLIKMKRF